MGTAQSKETIVGMFVRRVARPLCETADWLSWALFVVFLVVVLVAVLMRLHILEATGAADFYEKHEWQFLYTAWGLLVLSTTSPLIRVTKKRSGIPIGLLVSVAIFHLGAFIVISIVLLASRYPDNPTAVTALLAACAGAAMVGVGWVVQHNSAAKSARRSHTFSVLMQSRLSKEFQENSKGRDKYFPTRKVITVEDAGLNTRRGLETELSRLEEMLSPNAFAGLSEEEQVRRRQEIASLKTTAEEKYLALGCVQYILNFYEFLSAGIKRGDLDEGLLYETLSDIAIGLLRDCPNLIAAAQAVAPRCWEHFVEVASAWRDHGFQE